MVWAERFTRYTRRIRPGGSGMEIFDFLAEHGIRYQRCDHPAVFTCEEAERLVPPLPGAKVKNLFVTDKKGLRHFLVMVGYDTSVDLKALGGLLGAGGLRMASGERLRARLGVTPGSVTALAVVNDRDGAVQVVVDVNIWEAEAVLCHPLVNTSTLVLLHEDFRRFLDVTGHPARVLSVPSRRTGENNGT
jgi:Ala-tRNA(Pro) deacylase